MSNPNTRAFRIFLAIFVGWFALVIGVNLLLAYQAKHTFSGLVADDAYDKGLAYNKDLLEMRRESALGWSMTRQNVSGTLAYRVTDKSGAAVAAATVSATVLRPVGEAVSTTLMLPETQPGLYAAPFTYPAKGQWEVDLTITRGADVFTAADRVVIP